MSRTGPYTGNVDLINGLRRKNDGDFFLIDSPDVRTGDGISLQDSLEDMIKVNDDAEVATKIQITTTSQDVSLATTEDLEDSIVINGESEQVTKINITTTNEDIDLITIQDFQNIVADEFINNKAYAIGQYVLYENNLYKFITIHSAGSWDSNQVVQVKICNEISNLKTRLDNLETILNNLLNNV